MIGIGSPVLAVCVRCVLRFFWLVIIYGKYFESLFVKRTCERFSG